MELGLWPWAFDLSLALRTIHPWRTDQGQRPKTQDPRPFFLCQTKPEIEFVRWFAKYSRKQHQVMPHQSLRLVPHRPLAADIVSERRIEIVRRPSRRGSKASKLVAVGADHGGFKMKEELKAFLKELGHRVQDFGTNSEEAVDYPDF